MQKSVRFTLLVSLCILSGSTIYCKQAQFKKTRLQHYQLYLSRSNDRLQVPIIGLIKEEDGTFGGLKIDGKGEDGDITITESKYGDVFDTSADVFVTAEKLYRAVRSKRPSINIWVTTINGLKIRLSRELVSALRDKTVLSELYILTQEHVH